MFNEIVTDKGKTTVPRRQQDLQPAEHGVKITIIVRLSGMQLEKHRSKLVAPVRTAHTVDKLFILRVVTTINWSLSKRTLVHRFRLENILNLYHSFNELTQQ